MIKNNWIYILFAFSVIAYITSVIVYTKDADKMEAKALRLDKGWGYQILVNKKIYINQRIIPVVQGNKEFTTQEQALKVANLVISKMKKKASLPSVTIKELDSLGIEK